jgi:Protein of unknown function (DUF4019)
MGSLKICIFALAAVGLFGCGGMIKGKPAAERAIAHFHNLYNEGKVDEIWTDADPGFRSASTKEKYEALMAAVQRKLGKVVSSSNSIWNVRSFNMKTTVLMNQDTKFENGQGIESFTFAVNGTNAVLVGYNIQSADLITK